MKRRGYVDLAYSLAGVLLLVAIAFGGGWSHQGAAKRGRIPLRLAYFPNLAHAPAMVGLSQEIFQTALPGYVIETKVVNAGPEAMEALLAGDVDFAYVGPSPATNTFLKSGGRALRIVAGVCSGGASLVARSDVDIRSVRELDGHSVAVPQLGGTQDVSCRRFMALNGLASTEEGGTVTVLPLKNPDILALFKRREIDAAWAPEPWASRLKAEAGAKTVVDERSLWPAGKFTTAVLVVRTAFAKQYPEAVRAFARANGEAIGWINAHPEDGRKLVNAALKELTGKSLSREVLGEAWSRLSFTTDANPANIVQMADAAYGLGYLKERLSSSVGLYVDEDASRQKAYVK